MFCSRCGKEIPDNSVYCVFCSEKVGNNALSVPNNNCVPEVYYNSNSKKNTAATVSLVMGLLAILFSVTAFFFTIVWPLSMVLDVFAIILAIVSFVFTAKSSKIGNSAKATAGMVCSIIAVVFSGIGLIACVGCVTACATCTAMMM